MKAKQRIFFTSDEHFGHYSIIKYENRPFTNINTMQNTIINNWNKQVRHKDIVYCLGDFAFLSKEKVKDILKLLNGYKILVLGNHDKSHSIQWWYDVGFNEVYKYPILLNEFIILSHEPVSYMNVNSPYVNIHGHVHNSPNYPTMTTNSCNVCVERWNYSPVSLNAIKKEILKLNNKLYETIINFKPN